VSFWHSSCANQPTEIPVLNPGEQLAHSRLPVIGRAAGFDLGVSRAVRRAVAMKFDPEIQPTRAI
jgi:hypothetical protein